MKRLFLAVAIGVPAAALGWRAAVGQDANSLPAFTPEQIQAGAALYERNCAQCHGPHMVDPGGGYFDLRTFPPDRRARFVNSVTNGKNNMPPWRSVLTPEDIDNLFAYVIAGEKGK
jgi:mono/diheme cytochrome c family protein